MLRYRPMHYADIEQVALLASKLHVRPWSLEQITEALSLPRYACHVAVSGHQVAGYYIASHGLDVSDLLTIGVSPDYQRQSIASNLLNHLKQLTRLNENRDIFLEVRQSNDAAIALYHKMGFCQVGLRKQYYQTPDGIEDAITMICSL